MPMIVNVAGAGAGKTTKMADVIMAHDIPDGKVVFCIAFTNAAADNIKEKVAEKRLHALCSWRFLRYCIGVCPTFLLNCV